MSDVRLTSREALASFEGKSVALVGNAECIMAQAAGAEIDAHDVVIRMNAGVARQDDQVRALGQRTDVLTIGLLHLFESVRPLLIGPCVAWWMKLTALGQRQREVYENLPERLPTFFWPTEWENLVHLEVGAPPSTGIRLMHVLARMARPTQVDAYGFAFFGAAVTGGIYSHWKPGVPVAAPHQGQLELAHADRLGFVKAEGEGRWQWRP